jgi:polysaccharide pyruvyl transferase WcaK-like protein|tara:strand:+ start:128 stop:610 length:483 start_codon:yes stop_codon:yes gene_type:complete
VSNKLDKTIAFRLTDKERVNLEKYMYEKTSYTSISKLIRDITLSNTQNELDEIVNEMNVNVNADVNENVKQIGQNVYKNEDVNKNANIVNDVNNQDILGNVTKIQLAKELFELEKDLAIEKAKPRKKLLYFTILETIGVLLFVALAAFAVGFVFGFDWAS